VTELETAQQQIAELTEKLEDMRRQYERLVRQVFGRKSEQTPPAPVAGQMDLELEAENAAIESAPPASPERKKGGSKKGRKVRAALLPENLPVEETRLVPLVVQAQPEKFRQIGEDIVERLERIPGKLIRLRLVRPRFVRIDEPYAAPLTAPAPPALIEGGFFGPQFMIDMVLGKYLYHQPLYRQAKGMEWESGGGFRSPRCVRPSPASPMPCSRWSTAWRGTCGRAAACRWTSHRCGAFPGNMTAAASLARCGSVRPWTAVK
jgi:transposase